MVLGVSPTSYLVYRMTGLRPLGRPNLPSYIFKSVEPSFFPFKEILGDLVSVRPSLRGAYFHGSVLDKYSDELQRVYEGKLGFPVPLEIGNYQTVSVDLSKEQDGWYRRGEIDRIEVLKDGGFLVHIKGEEKPVEAPWIWSTLPLRVLLELLGKKKPNLPRIFIYRLRTKKAFSKQVRDLFDSEYEVIYDLDPDSPFARHIRIGIPNRPETVIWYSEIWSLGPVKVTEDVVKFWTVPYQLDRDIKLPPGVELIGAYSEWDYSLNMTHVLEKTRELARKYNISVAS